MYKFKVWLNQSSSFRYDFIKVNNIELLTVLLDALDLKDTYTLRHSENVAYLSLKLAKKINLSNSLYNGIYIGGLLHDIGKIGIPEQILMKPGILTYDEYNLIKNHPTIGYELIKHVSEFQESSVLDIVLFHHERYDGNGYPKGLKGTQIPLVARIVAIADAFDAMTSKRIYKHELELEQALSEIIKNKGTQFDPEIVDVFLNIFG